MLGPNFDILPPHEPKWIEWAKEYVTSGEFAKKLWLTERWITCDEAVFRFGVPRFHVVELTGYWANQVPWQYPDAHDEAPRLDAKVFARRKGLKAKQNTFIARHYQRALGLSHILPTAWDRLDATFP